MSLWPLVLACRSNGQVPRVGQSLDQTIVYQCFQMHQEQKGCTVLDSCPDDFVCIVIHVPQH
ncbi:hypothetical protein GBAR_LOCUS26523 [Geodia barretti]|uniref:Uncharacterized protein n=1 Tax=Geodia barretti TaxID=519541 RepID=A0AA35XD40_GEOBA|nr:hypothetical protein GBAR_LOCUS26523 [Geodia barretti]